MDQAPIDIARRRLAAAVCELEQCIVNDMWASTSIATDQVNLWARAVLALTTDRG